jgi:hypothetical protein
MWAQTTWAFRNGSQRKGASVILFGYSAERALWSEIITAFWRPPCAPKISRVKKTLQGFAAEDVKECESTKPAKKGGSKTEDLEAKRTAKHLTVNII